MNPRHHMVAGIWKIGKDENDIVTMLGNRESCWICNYGN